MTSAANSSVSWPAVPLPMAMTSTPFFKTIALMVFFCLIDPLELRHGVDDVRVQHLAGGVDDGDLAAHAVAGVKPHDRFAADGRLQKQLAQVVAKDLDRPLSGGVRQLAAQLVFKAGMNEAAVGVAGGGIHQRGAGTACLFAGEHPADDARRALGVDLNRNLQKPSRSPRSSASTRWPGILFSGSAKS